MKIEKINDNQIKCTLTRSDLASRQLKLSELAYGTEKARGLFQDMMDQANLEFGFDAAEFPLMIEAIPVSMDCIILMITKVEDPDEVDTRFSTLSNLKDLFGKESSEDHPFLPMEETSPDDLLLQFSALAKKAGQSSKSSTDRLYSFADLDDLIEFAHTIRAFDCGDSALYKSADNGRYYLCLSCSPDKSGDFSKICTAALEYAENEPYSDSRIAYMHEHFEEIIPEKAIDRLNLI